MKSIILKNLFFAIFVSIISGWGQPNTDIPACRVAISVREYGKIQKSNGDTVIALHKDTTVTLAVNILNSGKARNFNVRLQTNGIDIVDGMLNRQTTVDTGKTGVLQVAIRGKDVGPLCRSGLRSIRFLVTSQNDSEIVCGRGLRFFACPNKKKIPGR